MDLKDIGDIDQSIMCSEKVYVTCWECTRVFASIIQCFKQCLNKNEHIITIKDNNDFILIEEQLNNYKSKNKYFIDKDNENIYIKDLTNLQEHRVNYLFPIIVVEINGEKINIQIQKKREY